MRKRSICASSRCCASRSQPANIRWMNRRPRLSQRFWTSVGSRVTGARAGEHHAHGRRPTHRHGGVHESGAVGGRTRGDRHAQRCVCAGRGPFELLRGQVAARHRDKTIPESIRIVSESEPKTLSSINRAYRGDLDTIVAKAMEAREVKALSIGRRTCGDVRRYLRMSQFMRGAQHHYQFRASLRGGKQDSCGRRRGGVCRDCRRHHRQRDWPAQRSEANARAATAAAGRALAVTTSSPHAGFRAAGGRAGTRSAGWRCVSMQLQPNLKSRHCCDQP